MLEAQCTAAQESIAEMVAELDSVKDSFDQLKKEKIALETQLEELQTQIDELQVEKQTLIGSTQHANAQRDRLQGRIRVLEEDSARKRQEVSIMFTSFSDAMCNLRVT